MAVRLEFINIIVRIDAIREKVPGGLERILREDEELIGRVRWFDQHLLRDGAMVGSDANMLVGWWKREGLEPTAIDADGATVWKDLCVLGAMGGSMHRCDWLARIPHEIAVAHAEFDPGPVIGREEMGVVDEELCDVRGTPRWKRYPNWPIGFDPDAPDDDDGGWGSVRTRRSPFS